jgi:hypothetical protein
MYLKERRIKKRRKKKYTRESEVGFLWPVHAFIDSSGTPEGVILFLGSPSFGLGLYYVLHGT